MSFIFTLIILCLLAYWGHNIMKEKNRNPIIGALLGFAFGILGIIICFLHSKKEDSNNNQTMIKS